MTAGGEHSQPVATDLDVAIVGAGFAGLYAVHRLRELGLRVRAYERGAGIGGTWYWNRYPGCRCDIESIWYSYSFSEELQQEWTWSHRYAAQPEILAYLNHVADRFDLRRDIQLGTTVTAMAWDEDLRTWRVELNQSAAVTAAFVVLASGFLSDPLVPQIVDGFAGPVVHTGAWPPEGLDLEGRRVGIVGTGSSGIQSIPMIARQAAHLYVFQRTPQYAVPGWNRPLAPEEIQAVKENYSALRRRARAEALGGVPYAIAPHSAKEATPAERDAWLRTVWGCGGFAMGAAYPDIIFDEETNSIVGDWVKQRIAERLRSPALAERLMPRYPFAAKRLCVDTDYFETFHRQNVTLVDLRDAAISGAVPAGVQLTDGSMIELDILIFATGFDAGTGAIMAINPAGRGGRTIRATWGERIIAYLGIMAAGFPNMFMVNGPGSPSVLYNMPAAIEHHVDWIADAISLLRDRGVRTIEPEREAELEWGRRVDEAAAQTLYPKVDSWYMGANVPGKARACLAWTAGGPSYFKLVNDVVQSGYRGFRLQPGAL